MGQAMTLHTIRANFQPTPDGVRRAVFDGREHMIVPVVAIVEGVMNNALVPFDEFSRYAEAWNGRPVPVYHPEINGAPISANRPDVIERSTIGQTFNARCEGAKLKMEAWIDVAKAERLGYGALIAQLEAGEVIEVSTGYFADDDIKSGDWNGTPYGAIHRNIRPDHLALLPGQIGACSIQDGCGTRINSKKGSFAMKVNEAWAVLSKHLGLKANCACEGDSMDIVKEAEGLVKANALDAKQLAAIQKMAPADREVMAAFIAALQMAGDPGEMDEPDMAEDMPEDEMPEDMGEDYKGKNMSKNPAPKAQEKAPDIDALVANKVAEHLRRHDVVGKLKANDKNALSEDQMAAMPVDQLEAIEKMIRPADYSGAGGFATNSTAVDTNVTPMPLRGVLRGKKKEA
jgi:hypothetical protein